MHVKYVYLVLLTRYCWEVEPKTTVDRSIRKFNSDWLKDSDLKAWLVKRIDSNKKEYPQCLACNTTFINKKCSLLAHAKTDKHKGALANLQEKQKQQRALSSFINDPLGSNVKSVELRICLLIAEKNLPISVRDDFLRVFQHEILNQPVLTVLELRLVKLERPT